MEWGINRNDVTRGGVWADLNQDGFLDWIATNINGPFEAYQAQCDQSNWLTIRLRQKDGNTMGIGSRIHLEHDEISQYRWMLAGGSSLSSGGPPEVHFGLADASEVDITINWADGEDTTISGIQSRQIVTITRQH